MEIIAVLKTILFLLIDHVLKKGILWLVGSVIIGILSFVFGAYNFLYHLTPYLLFASFLALIGFIAYICVGALSIEDVAQRESLIQEQIPSLFYLLVFWAFWLIMAGASAIYGNPDKKIDTVIGGVKTLSEGQKNLPEALSQKMREDGGFLTIEKHREILESEKAELTKLLKTAHEREVFIYEKRLSEIEFILSNKKALELSYQETISDLKERVAELESFRDNLPPEILSKAIAALKQGDFDEADKLFQKTEEEGEKHIIAVAESKYQRGKIAESQLRYKDAQKLYADAVRLVPENAVYLTAAGNLEHNLGDLKAAINLQAKALKIREASLPANHPLIAESLSNLGASLDYYGDHDKAIEFYERALEIYRGSLNPNHPAIAGMLSNLGVAWRGKDDLKKAIAYHKEALEMREASMLENHLDVAESLNNLAAALGYDGQNDEAIKYLNRALKIYESILTSNNPKIASVLTNLGAEWAEKGAKETDGEKIQYLDTAIQYNERALKIRKNALPEDHPDTAMSLYNLGLNWDQKGNYDLAIQYHTQALEMRRKTLSPQHIEIANSLNDLGAALEHSGDPVQAVKYFEEALVIYKAVLGTDHSKTRRTEENLFITRQNIRNQKL